MKQTLHSAPVASEPEFSAIRQGLAGIRRRRLFLWATILLYLPALLIVLELNLSGDVMTKLFFLWVGLLCIAVGLATVAKCPRCRRAFHTNGPTFLPLRKCLHCGLHLRADKAKSTAPPAH